jgi:hypothetical protein
MVETQTAAPTQTTGETEMTELETLVSQLALARRISQEASEAVGELTRHLQQSDVFIATAKAAEEARASEAALDAALREYALKQYLTDSNKHPHEKVEIKKFTVVEIPNAEAAREWSFLNFRPALKLDTKVFEKAAKDGSIPTDLVCIIEEPRVQIATKL